MNQGVTDRVKKTAIGISVVLVLSIILRNVIPGFSGLALIGWLVYQFITRSMRSNKKKLIEAQYIENYFGQDDPAPGDEEHLPPSDFKPPQALNVRVKPEPHFIKTWRDAEQTACDWMKYFGFVDAKLTNLGPDEGIDVVSKRAVGQVKMEGVKTKRQTVQQHYGVAQGEGKLGLFFSQAGYTDEAINWANKVGMPLFEFNYQGEILCTNKNKINLPFEFE